MYIDVVWRPNKDEAPEIQTLWRIWGTSEEETSPENVSAGDQWCSFHESLFLLLLMVLSLFGATELLHGLRLQAKCGDDSRES